MPLEDNSAIFMLHSIARGPGPGVVVGGRLRVATQQQLLPVKLNDNDDAKPPTGATIPLPTSKCFLPQKAYRQGVVQSRKWLK